jgi:phosphonate transport system substrate-binding protein
MLCLTQCQQSADAPLGSLKNPVKIFFTPSSDAENITTNSDEFLAHLKKETGYFFKSRIPTSYISVVESLGSQRADIAVMNSFGYLLAHERYGAQAKLTAIRYGKTSYKGMIIAHRDADIHSIKDLNGRSMAFTDSSSTSGYLFPMKILKEHEVKPGQMVFAMKHDSVVTMVYQKQVEAGACFYSEPDDQGRIRDARSKVKVQFPDVEEVVQIVQLTEDILNDPFVFRKDMPEEMVTAIIAAIQSFLATPEGVASFSQTYNFEGVIPASDADYDSLRDMIRINELDPAALMQ